MNFKKTPQPNAAGPGPNSGDPVSASAPVPVDPVMAAALAAEIPPPGEVVNIVDLDEETKALIQTELAQEEGNETQSAFFTDPVGGYVVAGAGLGSALANYPGASKSNPDEVPATNASQQAPEASGETSPFGPLLLALRNTGGTAPASAENQTQTGESGGVILGNSNPVQFGPENNAGNALDEVLPLLTNSVNAISGQASAETAPLISLTGTAPHTLP